MIQLGRYATIVKQNLSAYRIAPENRFNLSASSGDGSLTATAEPVDTQLFVNLEGSDDEARMLLRMGERTCFLNAAMRSSNRTNLSVVLNGIEVQNS